MYHRRWQTVLLLFLLVPGAARAQAVRNNTLRADSIPDVGWRPIAIGAAVLGATLLVDSPIANVFESPGSAASARAANTFDKFGEITGIGVVIGGLGLASLATHDHRVVEATIRTAASVAVATGITEALK